MWKDTLRLVAGALGIPVSAGLSLLHRQLTGPRAVLDVEVRRWPGQAGRHHVLTRLRRAASDPAVIGVLLRLREPPGSWAAAEDLRDAIARLRRAGRGVYAYVEAPGNVEFWIASACDRVFLVPTGQVGLVGLGAELTFVGEALSRLGVQPDLEAAGAYKSAGETFTRRFASPENQEAVRALVDDLHAQLVAGVAAGRHLPVDTVRDLLTRAPLLATEAREHRLVDQLAYEDEVETWIKEHHGERSKLVKFAAWARRDAFLEWVDQWGDSGRKIAVVHLEGSIAVDGRSPSPMILSRHVVPAIRALNDDKDVAGVVLDVNSPGGSALASDLIWREVDRLRMSKPVVACFEGVAASGGYYLSAPAAEIIARPSTLTGSIGVFGGKMVAGDAMRRLGVHTQAVVAAPNATLFSPSHPFTDAQRLRFRESLQFFYDGFVERVAAGRKVPADQVEPHCRGRVWTGRLARERGLVDREGDLFDAIERARSLAGLHPGTFRVTNVSPQPRRTLGARIVQSVLRGSQPDLVDERLSAALGLLQTVVGSTRAPVAEWVALHPGEPLAMLPFDVDLR